MQAAEQRLRRIHRSGFERQIRGDSLECIKGPAAGEAARHVFREEPVGEDGVLIREASQGVTRQEGFDLLVIHQVSVSSLRSFLIAASVLVFTVPIGTPSS